LVDLDRIAGALPQNQTNYQKIMMRLKYTEIFFKLFLAARFKSTLKTPCVAHK
jgi:hypothetical protein